MGIRPLAIFPYVVMTIVAGNPSPRCQDSSWTVIADAEFRQNVTMLHRELYDPERKPERPQFDLILEQVKRKIEKESSYEIDFGKLDAVISEIGQLQSELKRLSQELNLMDDYEDEGGTAAYLQTVRAESHKVDEKFLSRIRYMNRPTPEKVEELNQIYFRNQVLIEENDATLESKGVTRRGLRQLRDLDIESMSKPDATNRHPSFPNIEAIESNGASSSTGSDSGSDMKRGRRPLLWHVSQRHDDDDSVYEERSEESQNESNSKPPPTDRLAEWVGGYASPAAARGVRVVPPRSLWTSYSAKVTKADSNIRPDIGLNEMPKVQLLQIAA